MLDIDFWFNNTPEDIASATVTFYPSNGTYAGNIYDKNGKIIGDFSAADSVEIENYFPGIFGE